MQSKKKATLPVDKSEARRLEQYCDQPPGRFADRVIMFDEEVVFDNGMRMAVQVVASSAPDLEPCWTQGVLFDKDGCQMGCTDVSESFLGEYFISAGGVDYVVDVVAKKQ